MGPASTLPVLAQRASLEAGSTPSEVAAAILHHFVPPPVRQAPAPVSRDSSPRGPQGRSAERRPPPPAP